MREDDRIVNAIFKGYEDLREELRKETVKAAKDEASMHVIEIMQNLPSIIDKSIAQNFRNQNDLIDKLFSGVTKQLIEHEKSNELRFTKIEEDVKYLEIRDISGFHMAKHGWKYLLGSMILGMILLAIVLNII